jgi:HK97 family phage prohead protease
MILRTKDNGFQTASVSILLDYLGVRKEMSGIQKVAGNVELIASVPFCLAGDVETGQGLPWTLSTFDLDRYGERIDPLGWDFKRYMENPVVEWAHRYDIPAIGKIEGLTIDDEGLHGVVYFNDKSYDPFGWSIGQRVKAGVIRAGSVGFRVMEIEIPSKEDAPSMGGKDGTSLIFRKQGLLEFSICNVPANPFALAKQVRSEKLEVRNERGDNAIRFWDMFLKIQPPC